MGKLNVRFLAGVVLALALNSNAQSAVSGFTGEATPIQSIGEVSAQPDTIVAIAAESQGLSPIAREDLPRGGTYWWVQPDGQAVPTPFPSTDMRQAIYQITDGQFLVDQTGGKVFTKRSRIGSQVVTESLTSAVTSQAEAVVNLINQVQETQFQQEFRMAMGFDMEGEDSGSPMTPDGFITSTPDYGTNLWITQVNINNGYLAGLGTNTEADVQYEIQSLTDLMQTNWQSEGFILGSEATNWTPLSVPQLGRTNLFIRLKSWATDGSGLPIWWQLQYFGTTGIDPNALDSTGDGWTIYQKYKMGLDPNVFYTPPAPQNLTVKYNGNTGAVILNWLPSSGAVTGYLVTKNDYQTGVTTNFNVSSSANSFADNVSGDVTFDPQSEGDTFYVDYSVQAQYAAGNSAAATVSLESAYPTVSLVAGTQGSAYVALPLLPPETTSLRLTRIDDFAEYYGYGDTSFNTNYVISVSTGTNGLYPIPENLLAVPPDGYGFAYYSWWVQTLNASNGATSVSQQISASYNGYNASDTAYRLVPPYIDGRAALKDNMRFLLRAASSSTPLALNNQGIGQVSQTNYVCAGLYHCDVRNYYSTSFLFNDQLVYDPLFPLENNYLYRNLVFTLSDMGTNGFLNTGLTAKHFISSSNLLFTNTPKYTLDIASAVSSGNNTTFSSVLTTNDARWLVQDNIYGGVINGNGSHAGTVGAMTNIYGLKLSSVELTYILTNQLYWGTYQLGDSTPVPWDGNPNAAYNDYVYLEYNDLQQPVFQTLNYYFARPNIDPMPEQNNSYFSHEFGTTNFAVTNQTPLMIVSAGQSVQVAGYAKLAILNGYTNRFAYLGQYFDQAYKMTNGVVTTNTTGVLSPYGNFFATEPGPMALVTMPDVDTGARGTCTVYSVSLQLDANHDGNMDLGFSGADATSADFPYTIWANNNYDRWKWDLLGLTYEQDDTKKATVPDCQYKISGLPAIPCPRDLEDYFRLWTPGLAAAMKALPANYTAQMVLSGGGQIRIFQAVEPNGGTNYLFAEATASNQVASATSLYIGLLTSDSPITLNIQTNFNEHFIFCGAQTGGAQIDLQILDQNQNVVADAPAYLQINDIKQMYERWTVGDEPATTNQEPMNVAIKATDNLPYGASAFQYTTPQDTNTPYILFVHGWNMESWEKDRFAETTFKRLYWQGYQGRFGSFRWPTYSDFPLGSWSWSAIDPRNFDKSESNAWASATGLLNKLNDLNAQYLGHVHLIAHSMGNVVAGEALRLATNQVVNTYAALQAAISAHAYDTNTPIRDTDASTPDRYANYWTNGAPCYFSNSGGARTNINFLNKNDWALTQLWPLDQDSKPDNAPPDFPGYFYSTPSGAHPSGFYKIVGSTDINFSFPSDTYTIFAFCDEASSYALGSQTNVSGIFAGNQVDLGAPPYNFNGNHTDHSGEFRSDNALRGLFWNKVLVQMNLK